SPRPPRLGLSQRTTQRGGSLARAQFPVPVPGTVYPPLLRQAPMCPPRWRLAPEPTRPLPGCLQTATSSRLCRRPCTPRPLFSSHSFLLHAHDLHLDPLRLACHRVHMQHHNLAVVPVRDSVEPVHHALGCIVYVGPPSPFRVQ